MSIRIGFREVGPGQPVLIVGEIGINHQGQLSTALEMVRSLKRCGADACKIQLYHAEEFCSPDAEYQGEKQEAMFRRYQLSYDDARAIKAECDREGLIFFGTPADIESARFLVQELGAPCVKIGSDDLVHHELLRDLAQLGVPVILSTGMAAWDEIVEAYNFLVGEMSGPWTDGWGFEGEVPVAVLACTSLYPCPAEYANISRLQILGKAFPSAIIGYSDHTDGIMAAIISVALGAVLVEKHFTLDRSQAGPDHAFSADPPMFTAMVKGIREAEAMLGTGQIDPSAEELEMRKLARRSIVAKASMPRGQVLTLDSLAYKRPGTGLPPSEASRLVGKRLRRDVAQDERITLEDVD